MENINSLLTMLGAAGLSASIVGGLVYFLLKNYMTTYISQKGENKALLEDIFDIKKSEATAVSEVSVRESMRLVALERRLEAHQDAYRLSRELIVCFETVGAPGLPLAIDNCHVWWNSNCLYLQEKSREVFMASVKAANYHADYKEATEDRRNNWEKIITAPGVIANSIGLSELPIENMSELTVGENDT